MTTQEYMRQIDADEPPCLHENIIPPVIGSNHEWGQERISETMQPGMWTREWVEGTLRGMSRSHGAGQSDGHDNQ
jgi:hypothetical protein